MMTEEGQDASLMGIRVGGENRLRRISERELIRCKAPITPDGRVDVLFEIR